jgi:hypothetical protein
LKCPHVGVILGYCVATDVGKFAVEIGADAEVVELVIREQGIGLADGVADLAIRFLRIGEDLQSPLRGR